MKKLQFYLSGFLALQLLLAVGLFWNQLHRQAQQQQSEALLAVASDKVQKLEISGGDKTVTLVKQGDQWQLPDLHGLPVDSGKLHTLLDKLDALEGNWPVATTSAARKRFEVAEDKFQKRLRLFGSGGDDQLLAELYVGTSPGFRKVNVRRADDDAIYAVALNSYDLPASADSWLDKSLLAAGPVKAIKGPDYQLSKQGDKWQFSVGDADLDTDKAADLASALAELQVTKTADKLPEGNRVQLTVTTNSGDLQYAFLKANDHCYVTRGDRQQAFEISSHNYDRIAGLRNQQLVRAAPEEKQRTADGKAPAKAPQDKAPQDKAVHS